MMASSVAPPFHGSNLKESRLSNIRNAPGWLALAGGVILILSSKLWVIAREGSPIPSWDQWDAEADLLYARYVSRSLSLEDLLASHNEHRIFFTRILNIVLLELAGQWDTIWQMVVNAALHSFALGTLLFVCTRSLDTVPRIVAIVITAASATVPVGWDNTLAGFQSQFYFLLLASICSLFLLVHAEAFSQRWFWGLLAGLSASLCMASGALAILASAVLIGLQFLIGLRRGGKELCAVVLLLIAGIGLVLITRHVPGHTALAAKSISQFLSGFTQLLAWPLSNKMRWAVLMLLPVAALFSLLVVRRSDFRTADWSVIAIALWVALQCASIAYSRATAVGASRYLDIVFVSLVVNLCAALRLYSDLLLSRKVTTVFLVIWLTIAGAGLMGLALPSAAVEAATRGRIGRLHSQLIADYLRSGSAEVFSRVQPNHRPYPDPTRLADLLSSPIIRGLLPVAVSGDPEAHRSVVQNLALKGRFAGLTFRLRTFLLSKAPSPLAGLGIALMSLGLLATVCRRQEADHDVLTTTTH